MKNIRISGVFLIAGIMVALLFSGCHSSVTLNDKNHPPKEKVIEFTIKAKIEKIDFQKRFVLLKSPLDNLVTLKAHKNIKFLNEMKKVKS